MRLEMREILVFSRGIDDDDDGIVDMREHEIVDEAAGRGRQKAVALTTLPQPQNIDRHQRFERQRDIFIAAGFRPDDDLPHVRDVEQPGRRAGPKVFFQDAERILHRHIIAGKGHHAGGVGEMQIVEGSRQQRAGFRHERLQSDTASIGGTAHNAPSLEPHLSLCLRVLSLRRAGERPLSRSYRRKRFFCLRVSGAVAPSALADASLSRFAGLSVIPLTQWVNQNVGRKRKTVGFGSAVSTGAAGMGNLPPMPARSLTLIPQQFASVRAATRRDAPADRSG